MPVAELAELFTMSFNTMICLYKNHKEQLMESEKEIVLQTMDKAVSMCLIGPEQLPWVLKELGYLCDEVEFAGPNVQ